MDRGPAERKEKKQGEEGQETKLIYRFALYGLPLQVCRAVLQTSVAMRLGARSCPQRTKENGTTERLSPNYRMRKHRRLPTQTSSSLPTLSTQSLIRVIDAILATTGFFSFIRFHSETPFPPSSL